MKNQISNLEYENQNLQMTISQLEMQNSQSGIPRPFFNKNLTKPSISALESLKTARYDNSQP